VSVFFKRKGYIVFGFLFFISIVPFLFPFTASNAVKKVHTELFNPKLSYINSLNKAVFYTDSVYSTYNLPQFDTAKYVHIASKFTKERFFHGLSTYSVSENWIALVCSKLIWNHLSAIVSANDILKYNSGLCSQQTIVFLEILKNKNIGFRTVGLGYKQGPGHFLCEVKFKGTWHIFDVNKEPRWERIIGSNNSMNYYMQNKDSLFLVYDGKLDRKVYNKIMEKVVYGDANEFPAKNMLLFHQVTKLLTYVIPIIFLLLSFWFYKKRA
jgi:hypothetical protein